MIQDARAGRTGTLRRLGQMHARYDGPVPLASDRDGGRLDSTVPVGPAYARLLGDMARRAAETVALRRTAAVRGRRDPALDDAVAELAGYRHAALAALAGAPQPFRRAASVDRST